MAFTGTLIWMSGGVLLHRYNTVDQSYTVLPASHPDLPSTFLQGYDTGEFGATMLLGDGNLAVPYWSETYAEPALIINTDLDVASITQWDNTHYYEYLGEGYTMPENSSTVYDPVTGLNWMERTRGASDPLTFNAYDSEGNWVQGVGDVRTIPIRGDAFIGGGSWPSNMAIYDRWLYRVLNYGDGIERYNLDTDQWQAIQMQSSPHGTGWKCQFVGVDDLTGNVITVNTTKPYDPDYDPSRGGNVQIRLPDGDPWANPVPDGVPVDSKMGEPLQEWNPHYYGHPSPYSGAQLYDGYGVGKMATVSQGKLIYSVDPSSGYGFDYGPDGLNEYGVPYGYTYEFFEMDLATGQIELIAQVPYSLFDQSGNPVEHNGLDYWWINTYEGVGGLTLIPGATSLISGRALGRRTRFARA